MNILTLLNINGFRLKELPINIHSLFGKEIIYTGGGYFRFVPYPFIKSWTKNSDYVMTYFHPRDFEFIDILEVEKRVDW